MIVHPDPTRPAIACLIATWRDGPLLAEAVRSTIGLVDATIVLDGAYEGVVADIDSCSSIEELGDAESEGAEVIAPVGLWHSEIVKRNVLLELGRACLGNHPNRWALVLDADELLVHGERLRDVCAAYMPHARSFAIPMPRLEPDGSAWAAPSRLFRLTEHVRYSHRSYLLYEPDRGRVINLEHTDRRGTETFSDWRYGLHVQHRWDLRSPWRAEMQRRYGRQLAQLDHGSA